MGYPSTHDRTRALPLDREQVAELLSRYPHVSDRESHQILTFLREGRHLDVGLLTSNDRLRSKLDVFMNDHKKHFRVTWSEGARAIAGIIAMLLVLWLAWEVISS